MVSRNILKEEFSGTADVLDVKYERTKSQVTALSLTEVGKTVGGMGLEETPDPRVGHIKFKMLFGKLSWNTGQQSGERAWLEGCICRLSAQR